MLDDRSSKAIKVKLAKAIELIVKEQSKDYNSKLCEVQLRLETIYDTIDKSIYKSNVVVNNYMGDGNKKRTTTEHN
tara:strand:+ start:540 stop:767 length:228 start_codon:yes stop_codon:yes gene_type:complete